MNEHVSVQPVGLERRGAVFFKTMDLVLRLNTKSTSVTRMASRWSSLFLPEISEGEHTEHTCDFVSLFLPAIEFSSQLSKSGAPHPNWAVGVGVLH